MTTSHDPEATTSLTEAALSGATTPDVGGNAESCLRHRQHPSDDAGSDPTQPLLSSQTSDSPREDDDDDDDDDDDEHLADHSHLHWSKRPNLWFLLVPFSIFTLAFGTVLVPRLNLILDTICRAYFLEDQKRGGQHILPIIGGDDNEQCQIPEVHARTSRFVLMMGLIGGFLAAFSSPRLGSLSDRYGRRHIMALSSVGLLAVEIATLIIIYFNDVTPNVFLIGSAVEGLCGSFMLSLAISYSYAADCTTTKHRATAFGALQGCFFLGIAIGPVLGGLIVEWTGSTISIFWMALIAHLIFLVYLLTLLPESLSQRRMLLAREKHELERARRGEGSRRWYMALSPRAFLRPLGILCPMGPGTSTRLRLNLIFLAIIDSTFFGVGLGAMTVVILYAERKFHWRNLESSIYVSIVNSTRVTMLFLILPLLISFFRSRKPGRAPSRGSDTLDHSIIRFAIFIEALGYVLYSFAPTSAVFTLAGALSSLGGVGSPTAQSALTKHVPQEKTGQLLGAIALLHSLARMLSPIAFNLIYAATVATKPWVVFICLAATFSVAFGCSWGLKKGVWWTPVNEREEGGEEGEAERGDGREAEGERVERGEEGTGRDREM